MIKGYPLTQLFYSVSVVIACTLVIIFSSFAFNPLILAFAQLGTSQQPDINATSLFDTGQMILPNNVKHLIILIPDEAHHGPGEEDESRFIAQPFVPQDAVVGSGTQVVWYNGDVGHEHNIVVSDGNGGNQVFETGEFTELTSSRPIIFNNTGNFNYVDTVDYEEGFQMTGNITIVNGGDNSVTPSSTFDTVGALMVPSMMVQSVADEMRNAGFGIDSMHAFTDLRGGQEDTGDEQVLVVWTTAGKSLDDSTSQLKQISEGLPYE
jgi:plastocyanin